MNEWGAASQAGLSANPGGVVDQSTPEGQALARLAEAVRAFAQAVQSEALPLQVRVHVFCDPRGRPAGPALDVTYQALRPGHLQHVSESFEGWENQTRSHGWSPGQRPWDVANRTPGEYQSLLGRIEAGGMTVAVRLEGDAAFYETPSPAPAPVATEAVTTDAAAPEPAWEGPAWSDPFPATAPPRPDVSEPEFDPNSWMATFLASQPGPAEEQPE